MLYTILFLILTYFILTHSDISLYYAFHGFTLWYSKMIPSLLPFMIISGILIRMNLSEKFAGILHPIFKRIFKCRANVSYGIMLGFLCGFPMGARVCTDLYKNHKISLTEARFLLYFTNNIGPVYFCSFVIPLLELTPPLPYLLGMYGIPFLYGIVLRYTRFRNMVTEADGLVQDTVELSHNTINKSSLLDAVDDSIKSAVQSILMLCGYMILFNTLNILPHYLLPSLHVYLAPLLEITGGLSMLGKTLPLYSLCLLSFGGFSCIAQTNSMITGTELSIREYIIHKVIITLFAVLFYMLLIFFGICSF